MYVVLSAQVPLLLDELGVDDLVRGVVAGDQVLVERQLELAGRSRVEALAGGQAGLLLLSGGRAGRRVQVRF